MKSNLFKAISLFVLIVIASTQLKAQEKPFRIGVKAGFPNLVTGNLEYVTPLLNERLAFMIDYSKFTFEAEDAKLDYSYFEVGTNYYLRREGHGPYLGISYTNLSLDFLYEEKESESNPNAVGRATANIDVNTLNIKLGAKWGGLIYFRPEIGYSFTALPNTVEAKVEFENEPTEYHVEEVPSVLTAGFIFNIGFGFSF